MNEAHLQRLRQAIQDTCSLLATSMIKLYFADKSRKFQYSKLCGALCLVLDRKQSSIKHSKLYDLSTFSVTFDCEMYLNFSKHYVKLSELFFAFPLSYGWAGLLFLSQDEAHDFKRKIDQFSDQVDPSDFQEKISRESAGLVSGVVNWDHYELQKIFVNRNYFKTDKLSEKNFEEIADLNITKPTNIERTSNAGWDPVKQCFNLSEIPKPLKQLLKNAGITKKDLMMKDIALKVYEILMNPTQLDSVLVKMKSVDSSKVDSPKKEAKKGSFASEFHPSNTSQAILQNFGEDSNAKRAIMTGINAEINQEEPKAREEISSKMIISTNTQNNPGQNSISVVPQPIMANRTSIIVNAPVATQAGPIKGNFLDQIKAGKFNLKKADPTKNTMFKDVMENKQIQMKTASTLHAAIVERRGQLTKNEVKDSDEENWSSESD